MLRAFGHPVAMCCDMLGFVGSSLKMVKFEPTTACRNRVAKRTKHVTPNNVAICCDRLAGALGSFVGSAPSHCNTNEKSQLQCNQGHATKFSTDFTTKNREG